ncbi:hypothetical protein JCM10908_000185 [Rhodotorula pacifica]|uniref:uncharacterized protein n=1 Tax=Rhodotorula pacifica TaxID=1495444 RepID=UPI00317C38C6
MSINPSLLVRQTPATDDLASGEGADAEDLDAGIFYVDCLKDVAVKDLVQLGTPLEEWDADVDRYEVRYLVKDTWEPRRNLNDWQSSYDDDLAKIAARKPPGFDLKALHVEAKRRSAEWRKVEQLKAAKKTAAATGKKSTVKDSPGTKAKGLEKGEKVKKGKTEDKEKKKRRGSKESTGKPDSSSKSRSAKAASVGGVPASPAPSSTSRAARLQRRSTLGGETLDQAAVNEFIATNGQNLGGLRALRFTPPPKHDEFGNLIRSSSDTEEDSPTPEPVPQAAISAALTASAGVTHGFAGSDDEEEDVQQAAGDVDHLSVSHSSETKPSVPYLQDTSAEQAVHGFAGGDEEEEEEDQPAAAAFVSAPEPDSAMADMHGFAGSDEDDDEAMPSAGAALDTDRHGAENAISTVAHGSAAAAQTETISFGFAKGDDEDGDEAYFPNLAVASPAPAGDGAGMSSGAEPAAANSVEIKVEEAHGFAGDEDEDGDDDHDMGRPEAVGADKDAAAEDDVAMAEEASAEHASAPDHRPSPRVEEVASAGHEALPREPASMSNAGVTTAVSAAEPTSVPSATGAPAPASVTAMPIERTALRPAAASAPTAMSPPPPRRSASARSSPEKEGLARSREGSMRASGAPDGRDSGAASHSRDRVSASPADVHHTSSRAPSRNQSEEVDGERQRLPSKRKRPATAADDAAPEEGDDNPPNAMSRLKTRRKGDAHPHETSPVDIQPSPGASGGSDSRGSANAAKVNDPFNHGRVRSNASNGYIRWNAAALRSKNFSQVLTANERVSWPQEGPDSIFGGTGDVEVEKIKFLWSIGRYGNLTNGTDTFDEIMTPAVGEMDVWIAPPPDESKAFVDKSAKAQLNEYQALQLVLASYPGLLQADSPRNSVKVVFLHVSKLGELSSTTGAFAQLEHLRSHSSTRFFVYGRSEKLKRALQQIWRSAVAITFSPAALLRQASHLEALLQKWDKVMDEDTQTRKVFPWLPLQYVIPGGPLGRSKPAEDTPSAPAPERDDARRAAVLQVLPLLAHKQLILADFAPPKDKCPLPYPVFPAKSDRAVYGGPQRIYFELLGEELGKMSLDHLQNLVAGWRSRYPLVRNWQIVCTQQELASASKTALPGIELCSAFDAEKRFGP